MSTRACFSVLLREPHSTESRGTETRVILAKSSQELCEPLLVGDIFVCILPTTSNVINSKGYVQLYS